MQTTCIADPQQLTRIDGNIDPSTGHVTAPGDLHVRGNIADLHQCRCAGNAVVEGVIEAAAVIVEGDLNANGGISGKHKGRCKVGRSLRARYITHSTIESGGDIQIETEVSNSCIFCGGDLKVENGTLVGGQVIGSGSVICQSLGSPAAMPTLIEVGVDDVLRQMSLTSLPGIERCKREAGQIREQMEPLLKNQKNLTRQQKEMVTEKLFEADGLEEQANELHEAMKKRWKSFVSRPEPAVIVTNVLYAGTTIRIGRFQTTIDSAIKGPLRLVARTALEHGYIALFQDDQQRAFPLPTHPFSDPVWENVVRAMQQAD